MWQGNECENDVHELEYHDEKNAKIFLVKYTIAYVTSVIIRLWRLLTTYKILQMKVKPMAKYLIVELTKHYHIVECEDEIDPEQLIDKANHDVHRFDTGYEAIEGVLQGYEKQYGFEYKVQPNACGTETVNMDLQEELE